MESHEMMDMIVISLIDSTFGFEDENNWATTAV